MIAPGSMQRREGADGDRLLSYIEVAETADTAKERGRSVRASVSLPSAFSGQLLAGPAGWECEPHPIDSTCSRAW